MILRMHLVPKSSIRLFKSVFSVHVSQPYSMTGDHQQLEDPNLGPSAQVPKTPNIRAERVHNDVGQANLQYDFLA